MAEDYLWDGTGSVDPEIAALESTLAVLRLPKPLRAPVVEPSPRPVPAATRRGWSTTLSVAVLGAAATGALIWAWVVGTRPDRAPPPSEVIQSVHVTPAPVDVAADPTTVPDPTAVPVPVPVPVPMPATETNADAAVDPSPTPAPARPAASSGRPTLTSRDVRAGITPHEDEARGCANEHPLTDGDKVTVKLTIAGATGRVTASTAVGRYAGTALGTCVADALGAATFPTFDKTSIGVQYPVRMNRAEPSSPPDPDPSDDSSRRTLTSSDIKDGIAPHKAAAKACGPKHGAVPGEKVTIKLSIAGATGRVTSATTQGEHAGTALGNCVAAALKAATFPTFDKASIGVQYPVRM